MLRALPFHRLGFKSRRRRRFLPSSCNKPTFPNSNLTRNVRRKTTFCTLRMSYLLIITIIIIVITNGGMGNECQRFLKHLADKIAQKDTEPYHVVITWLRTQISFELLRSVHACVRGSRTPFRSKLEQSLDCKINVASADI